MVSVGGEFAGIAVQATPITPGGQLGNAIGVALVGLVFYAAATRGIDVAFERSLACLAGATLVLAVVTSLTAWPKRNLSRPPT